MYVLRNAPIIPKVEAVEPKTFPILRKTAESLVNSMALMDMHYIYLDAKDHQVEFHLAYMPSTFRDPEDFFDPSYMTELFELAFQRAKEGYPWESKPPKFRHKAVRAIP